MPTFFGSSGRETSSVKHFEIRLEQSNLILRGTEDEASGVALKGTVVLCLSEPLRIQGIRLRLTGEKRLGWSQSGGSGSNQVKQEDIFYRKTWDFLGNGRNSETLPAGNYEYPFSEILSGALPESVEGMPDSWIVYRLKGTIQRGILQQNPVAKKHLRVIRTLDAAALEIRHAMSVQNIWPEKVDYSLSTPTKAVIFGTNVQVDLRLVPLLKGLKFGRVTTELNEKQEFTINSRHPRRCRQNNRVVFRDEYRLPEDAETEDIEGQEGYQFSRSIPVPPTLVKCLQSVDAQGIRIKHNITFNIQMHNPDGHISELHATLPIFIFLSPNMPLDDQHNLVNQGSHPMDAAAAMEDLTPPQYGEHHFDQLYSDIDPSGFVTPAGGLSGMSTPLASRSRNVSTENLASSDNLASNDFTTLQSRLNTLDAAGTNAIIRERQPHRSQLSSSGDANGSYLDVHWWDNSGTSTPQNSLPRTGYFGHPRTNSNAQSPGDSDPVSRRVSVEDSVSSGPATPPQHIEYSAEILSKVPSYTTALQSQTRTPVNSGLPTYQSATQEALPSPPQQFGQAHVNGRNRDA